MKKILTAAALAISAVIMFASCNKDYTCTCTVQSSGDTHVISKDIGTTTQDDAKSKCNTMREQYTDPASSVTADCHI